MSVKTSSARRSSAGLGVQPTRLAERRRQRRRRLTASFFILFLLLLSAAMYGLWREPVRISRVHAGTAGADIVEIASQAMQGSYLGIVPRDSMFFFPAADIRAAILAAHPEIAAVSLARDGLTGLTIRADARVPVARWCGLAPTPDVEEYCYAFDAHGFIFAAAATGTEAINNFTLYAPLVGDTLEPLRATITYAAQLPSVFDFARQLGTLGSPVSAIVLRDDEIDDYLSSGTRVTYLLGDEQGAFTALVSGRQGATELNLADGSLEYVDLRFDGKIYLKRKK